MYFRRSSRSTRSPEQTMRQSFTHCSLHSVVSDVRDSRSPALERLGGLSSQIRPNRANDKIQIDGVRYWYATASLDAFETNLENHRTRVTQTDSTGFAATLADVIDEPAIGAGFRTATARSRRHPTARSSRGCSPRKTSSWSVRTMSMGVGERLQAQFTAPEAADRTVVASGTSCLEQLDALLTRQPKHPISLTERVDSTSPRAIVASAATGIRVSRGIPSQHVVVTRIYNSQSM